MKTMKEYEIKYTQNIHKYYPKQENVYLLKVRMLWKYIKILLDIHGEILIIYSFCYGL